MSITAEAISKFNEDVIDTFCHCIIKISENLKKRYDPDSPESNALFRLFCTASRIQNQIVNKYLQALEKQNSSQKENQNTRNPVNNNQSSFNNIPNDKANSSLMAQNKSRKQLGSFWRKKKSV